MKPMLTGRMFRIVQILQGDIPIGLQLQFRDAEGGWAVTGEDTTNESVRIGLTEIANVLAALGDCDEAKEVLVRHVLAKQDAGQVFEGVDAFVAAEMERLEKERGDAQE